jgi:hypothetical protein
MKLNPKKKIADSINKVGNLIPKAKSVFAGGAPVPLNIGSLISKAGVAKLKNTLPPFVNPTVLIEGAPMLGLPSIPSVADLKGKLPKLPKIDF